ncbi:hypothetical protein M0208_16500 [Sphingomonas sp. SUN019]|uniref:hypothetical protein n=1 Tax=Sphingomonas sp. SUN019 TaxID=2937788 RepID=UPI0021646D18|nr:hypothetical protein [Sphingomonas sp. SUN019]UVO52033.1 hypothetical protein M0208_16500 [Sphingomonas sp. SUN019]
MTMLDQRSTAYNSTVDVPKSSEGSGKTTYLPGFSTIAVFVELYRSARGSLKASKQK